MTKFSRYILVAISIITLAVILPDLYDTIFEKPSNTPFIHYSVTQKEFMLANFKDDKFYSEYGEPFTRSEYEQALPLLYSRQLIVDKTWPDSILGIEANLHTLLQYRSSFKLKPEEVSRPHSKLFPLFNSESGRAVLSFPEDAFRITWRMEFIVTETNKINERKSRDFSALLYKEGFTFPSKKISGIPSKRKSCDEGYFVIDSDDQLFHIKLVKGYPYVKKINFDKDITIKNIYCVDQKDKRNYAYLVDNNNLIYALGQDAYSITKLPFDTYSPEKEEIRILGNYFCYLITTISDHNMVCMALDRDYKTIAEYKYEWTANEDTKIGRARAALFPFSIKMTDRKSSFIDFYTALPSGILWIILNLVLATAFFIKVRANNKVPKYQMLDAIIIAMTGILGFISVLIFPNKFK